MSLDWFLNPTLQNWWQFCLFMAIPALLLLKLCRFFFIQLYSATLSPKAAATVGTMAAYVILSVAIVADLTYHIFTNKDRIYKMFYDYSIPLLILLFFIIMLFVNYFRAKSMYKTKSQQT